MPHHLGLDADRVGDHRQPRRHVLQHLQPALAPAPASSGTQLMPMSAAGDLRRLAVLRPGTGDDRQVLKLQEAIADQLQAQPGQALADLFEQRPDRLQARERAGRADPDQLHAAAGRPCSARG